MIGSWCMYKAAGIKQQQMIKHEELLKKYADREARIEARNAARNAARNKA